MKKTNKNTTLSPEQYIRQKARMLPLGQCYMNKNWFISGIAIAVVCRCHKQDTYTFGVFQFDTFCTGLIECKIEFSRDKDSYNNIMAYLKDSFKIEPVTYQEVHNLIYGAIAFGEDAGFTPPTNFNLAKYLLEEDTEDIPLINYQFGRFGKHFLLADSEQELDEFMPHLIAHLGKENILFGIEGSDRYFKGEDFYDSETRKVMRQIVSKIRHDKETPLEEYSYKHPAYPTQLQLKHGEIEEMLYDPNNRLVLKEEQLNQLLALPHEELREDLEQILLYETGRTCDEIPSIDMDKMNSALIHCLLLLGELGYKESLPVILETMCQNKSFYEYQLGIMINETYVPTLYNIGKDQLDKFFEFLQIPGIYTYARYLIFPTVVQIVEHEPERRGEVIEWLRKVLKFYAENLAENHCCDGSLIGLLATDLVKLKAEELLPELKVLYETGKVNEQCCGNYGNVVAMMKQPNPFKIQYHFEVHERYQELENGMEQLIAAHNNLLVGLMEEKAETNVASSTSEETQDVEDITTIEKVEPAEETKTTEEAKKQEGEVAAKAQEVATSKNVTVPKSKTATKKAKSESSKKDTKKSTGEAEKAKKPKAVKATKSTTAKTTKKTTKEVKEKVEKKVSARKAKEE